MKGLRTELAWAEAMTRDQFEELLGSMLRARLIDVEDAEFEKDGKVIPYRKISLTDAGHELRPNSPVEMLISDGIVAEFGSQSAAAPSKERKGKSGTVKPVAEKKRAAMPQSQTPESQELVGRLKEWRAAEAKRLGLPAYMVLPDRTLAALAHARPQNPNQLLTIDGIGPAKVEKFGVAILAVCGAG